MLKWPERARAAIKKLFEPLQDIDVYVEDLHDEAFYKTLLNRVSEGKVKIARVFSLGSRTAVVDAARLHDHSNRRALFIIDGDLEWVLGMQPPNVIGLHRHDAYCIENILICEKALCEILTQEIVIADDEATTTLGLSAWIQSVQPHLLELFAAFATARKFAPEEQTVAQGVGCICTKMQSGNTALDPKKVAAATNKALLASETMVGKQKTTSAYQDILARLKTLAFPLHAVSGKDYLLPLLDFRLQSLGCRIKRKSLRMRLAMGGDVNRFSSLNNAIRSAAVGFS